MKMLNKLWLLVTVVAAVKALVAMVMVVGKVRRVGRVRDIILGPKEGSRLGKRGDHCPVAVMESAVTVMGRKVVAETALMVIGRVMGKVSLVLRCCSIFSIRM
ncbi:hypothetical protein Lalb_Chr08g0233141 [Lupinus albus]|uniref:Uncharacterized protein n=1 Tax=Lupinus albus TaxID=3870 RepID=A0A6A4Q304_LUPAL|nr:hypothetical protein Lalb_Chr08g0233141 [Lupinus albus]